MEKKPPDKSDFKYALKFHRFTRVILQNVNETFLNNWCTWSISMPLAGPALKFRGTLHPYPNCLKRKCIYDTTKKEEAHILEQVTTAVRTAWFPSSDQQDPINTQEVNQSRSVKSEEEVPYLEHGVHQSYGEGEKPENFEANDKRQTSTRRVSAPPVLGSISEIAEEGELSNKEPTLDLNDNEVLEMKSLQGETTTPKQNDQEEARPEKEISLEQATGFQQDRVSPSSLTSARSRKSLTAVARSQGSVLKSALYQESRGSGEKSGERFKECTL